MHVCKYIHVRIYIFACHNTINKEVTAAQAGGIPCTPLPHPQMVTMVTYEDTKELGLCFHSVRETWTSWDQSEVNPAVGIKSCDNQVIVM